MEIVLVNLSLLLSRVPTALRDSTPNKEDPTAHNDIGDASDLHDGEVAAADNDPDETSL